MTMTLEQLRIFAAVADKQHVTQAAHELNLTQSATSAAIAALEGRYGVKLFDRVGRGIVLTHMGRCFLNEARAVLARAHAAEQVLRDFAGLTAGKLVISASQTVGSYWLPARLLAFQATYPGIEIEVRIANTEQVATDVREGMGGCRLHRGRRRRSCIVRPPRRHRYAGRCSGRTTPVGDPAVASS
ncbi:DNA-binding transcriptional LysR family regulator [Bradyrhizobium sp. JR3.5]